MKKDFESIEISPSSCKILKGTHTSSKVNINSHRSRTSERDTKRESLSASKFITKKAIIATPKSPKVLLSPKGAKSLKKDVSKRQIIQTTNTLKCSPNSPFKKNNNTTKKAKSQLFEPVFDGAASPEINKYSNMNNLDHSFGIDNSCIQSIDNFTQKALFDCQASEAQATNRDMDFNNHPSEFLISNASNFKRLNHSIDEREDYQDQIITSIRILLS